jgi:hypothetical protein
VNRSSSPRRGDVCHSWAAATLRCGLLGLLACTGCADQAAPVNDLPVSTAKPLPLPQPPQSAGSSPSSTSAGSTLTAPVEKRLAGVRLTIPAGWEEIPVASEFLLGEYRIAGAAGPARLTLSSAGGDMTANIERWRGQFTPGPDDPPGDQRTVRVDARDVTIVELHGTFSDGFRSGDPQPGSQLLGAILPTGPAHFFIKLTGPRATVTAARDAFETLVQSARFE